MKIIKVTNFSDLLNYKDQYEKLMVNFNNLASQNYDLHQIEMSQDFFQSFGAHLYFILCIEDGEIIGLFPFQRKLLGPFKIFRKIEFWGEIDSYASNHYPAIFLKLGSEYAIDAVVHYLTTTVSNEWDLISLTMLETDQNISRFINQFNNNQKHLNTVNKTCTYKHFLNTVQEQNVKISRKVREAERRMNREIPGVSLEVCTEIDDKLFTKMVSLHTEHQIFKERAGSKRKIIFESNNSYNYFKSKFLLWENQGWLEFYYLKYNNQILSFVVLRKATTDAFIYLFAYDVLCSKYQPYRYIVYKIIEQLCENEDYKEIDLGWGMNLPKEDLTNSSELVQRVTITSNNVYSKLLLKVIDLAKK